MMSSRGEGSGNTKRPLGGGRTAVGTVRGWDGTWSRCYRPGWRVGGRWAIPSDLGRPDVPHHPGPLLPRWRPLRPAFCRYFMQMARGRSDPDLFVVSPPRGRPAAYRAASYPGRMPFRWFWSHAVLVAPV